MKPNDKKYAYLKYEKPMRYIEPMPIQWGEIAKYVVIGFIMVVAFYFGST